MEGKKKEERGRTHDITVAEVKACPAFSHFTEEQANEVVATLKQFTIITYRLFQQDLAKPINLRNNL